ncbi:DUF2945 domain-containing protein [Aeromicrobium phragmitis]|uniref:DUF2945 domain-containing protein n=1 Tax=Aeromicrobium phragmitis TaxID=2478914 RepID=A0A3L8PHX9_9ACTN|nr:DUF2945 domain-containing protein [Aeromicrobium phragmitis]RLV54754.1 DUF2945 domain-containing protein [Aeromicrobium phragmitis]
MGISQGDEVTWNTSQGRTRGRAVEKRVERFEFEGQTFNASADEPYWIVESGTTGARAAHKEGSLDKRR